MSEISLKELQVQKKEMEGEILKAVQKFYDNTNLEVRSIFLEQHLNYNVGKVKYCAARTEIKI